MIIKDCLRSKHDEVDAYAGVAAVADRLARRGFMVVRQDGHFRGILTADDILKRPKRLVVDCLCERPRVDANWSVAKVLTLMEQSGCNIVPVMDRDRFMGVVVRGDLAKTIARSQSRLEADLARERNRTRASRQKLRVEHDRRVEAERHLHRVVSAAKEEREALAAKAADVAKLWERLCAQRDRSGGDLLGELDDRFRALCSMLDLGVRLPVPPRVRQPVTLNVVLADDTPIIHQVVTSGLAEHPTVHIAGEAYDGREAVELALRLRPDLLLMDINMPRLDGIAATRKLMKSWPQARVLIMSLNTDKATVERALAAGACGYIAKDSLFDDLDAAIATVSAGDSFISPSLRCATQ